MKIERRNIGDRFAGIVIAGDLVFLAGQVARGGGSTVGEQTRQVLSQIDALLAEAGTDKTRLLQVTIYLADIKTAPEMNKVWLEWVDLANAPTRATVEAALVTPDLLIEIVAVAAR